MHREILENIDVSESLVDFPRTELDKDIWVQEDGDDYTLRKDVELQILEYLSSCPEEDLNLITKDLHIVGSIGTNLYLPETDIDVHIIPRDEVIPDNEEAIGDWTWGVKKWGDANPIFIGEHPVEIFIQTHEGGDLLSDGCYDVFTKEWLVGPKIYPMGYNPYSELSDLADEVRKYAQEADLDLGELKRDVIDYDTIKSVLEQLPAKHKEKLKVSLQSKLGEMEDDIRALLKDKKDWVDMRQASSSPDVVGGLSKEDKALKRREADTVYKFLGRYQYREVISSLEKMLQDDSKITDDEVSLMYKVIA